MSREPEDGSATSQGLTREKRQERIIQLLLQQGSVGVDELIKYLRVSRMTVHRDLDELEAAQVLRKFRGGATVERSTLFESDLRYRLRMAVDEKEALAKLGAGLVERGQAVMLDESSTMLPLARRLIKAGPLTIITNFVSIMQLVADARGIRLIGLGGEYLPQYNAFRGMFCERMIEGIRADVLFMSVSAVSGNATFHQEGQVVATKRKMLRSADRKILLVDHTKLGKTALYQTAVLEEFDTVVVDDGVDEEALATLREAHPDVRVAAR
jgi:DeoR/GlpR family transcriptional regulator of sugar metabolism